MTPVTKFIRAGFLGVYTFLSSLVVVMVGDIGFSELTDGQWLAAVVVGLGAGGGVYGVTAVLTKTTPTP